MRQNVGCQWADEERRYVRVVEDLQEPNFFDNGLSVAVRPFGIGWAKAKLRLRLRPDRRELRVGLSITATDLGIKGPYVDARVMYDDAEFDEVGPNLDRILWRGAIGYKRSGFDVQAGVSFLEK